MSSSKTGSRSMLILCAVLTITVLAAAGCATVPQTGSSARPAAVLPDYTEGTTFIYTDGSWETVAAAGPSTVDWVNQRGDVSSGSPDFTRRRAKWQTKRRQGTRMFAARRDIIAANAAPLWPLRVGNTTSYSETVFWRETGGPENSYQSWWSCEVIGTERVSVMAGSFDAWKIECRRYSVSGSRRASYLREVKTWYYAPEVGHYVLTIRTLNGRKAEKRRELLAVLPARNNIPPEASRKMDRSFQQALEFKKSGEPVRWSNRESEISGEILAVNTFKTPDGKYYRRYVQTLKLPGSHRTYYGLAVRSSNGVWTIPRR